MGLHHTVEQGDCLSSLAARFGLRNWRVIYDHPENAGLRRLRPDPNLIHPGDIVFIPVEPAESSAATDRSHRFRVSAPKTRLRLQLRNMAGQPVASKPFVLVVGDRQTVGTTSADGLIDEEIDAAAQDGLLRVVGANPFAPAEKVEWRLRLGHLDPIDTVSGIQARLNNLGFEAGRVDGIVGPRTRGAVARFQRQHGLRVDGIAGALTQAKLRQVYGC